MPLRFAVIQVRQILLQRLVQARLLRLYVSRYLFSFLVSFVFGRFGMRLSHVFSRRIRKSVIKIVGVDAAMARQGFGLRSLILPLFDLTEVRIRAAVAGSGRSALVTIGRL